MPQVGFLIGGRSVVFADAREMSERGELTIPPAFLSAIWNGRQDKTPSPSSIANCLRRFELQRTTDYYQTPESSITPFMGTAAHAFLADHAEADDLVEQRVGVWLDFPDLPEPYDRIRFQGTADVVNMRRGLIRDWKSKRYIPAQFAPDPTHIAQVNIYAWLWWENASPEVPEPLSNYEIVYFDQSKVKTVRGKLLEPTRIKKYVMDRLRLWAVHAAEGKLPPPLEGFDAAKPKAPCSYCPVRQTCIERYENALHSDPAQNGS